MDEPIGKRLSARARDLSDGQQTRRHQSSTRRHQGEPPWFGLILTHSRRVGQCFERLVSPELERPPDGQAAAEGPMGGKVPRMSASERLKLRVRRFERLVRDRRCDGKRWADVTAAPAPIGRPAEAGSPDGHRRAAAGRGGGFRPSRSPPSREPPEGLRSTPVEITQACLEALREHTPTHGRPLASPDRHGILRAAHGGAAP